MSTTGWSDTHPSLERGLLPQPNRSLAALAPLRWPAEGRCWTGSVSPRSRAQLWTPSASLAQGLLPCRGQPGSLLVSRLTCQPLTAIVRDYYLQGL